MSEQLLHFVFAVSSGPLAQCNDNSIHPPRHRRASPSSAPPPRLLLLLLLLQTWLSGVGFFADAYDLFCINIVKNIMASLYPQSTAQAADLATAAIIGAVIGQLFFGALADVLGRRAIFIATLTIGIVAALGSATCIDSPALSIYTQLSLWRGLLGFGIGGECVVACAHAHLSLPPALARPWHPRAVLYHRLSLSLLASAANLAGTLCRRP